MPTYDISGEMPYVPGSGYREGPLLEYPIFRWHSGGRPEFRLDEIKGRATSGGVFTHLDIKNLGVNLGLRRSDDVQVAYVKYPTGVRGRKLFSASIPAGRYAMNARQRSRGTGASFAVFIGRLYMGTGPNPV